MANIFGKLKDIIGGSDYQYDEEMEQITDESLPTTFEDPIPLEDEEIVPAPVKQKSRRRNREKSTFQMDFPPESSISNNNISNNIPNNVIEMPGVENAMNEVVVIEPHTFEEVPQVIKTLKERRCVVLNLNVMDPDEAQRAVDFVAGGTYAIDGHQERIGESIFLFTPKTVKVSTVGGNTPTVKETVKKTTTRITMPESIWDNQPTQLAQ